MESTLVKLTDSVLRLDLSDSEVRQTLIELANTASSLCDPQRCRMTVEENADAMRGVWETLVTTLPIADRVNLSRLFGTALVVIDPLIELEDFYQSVDLKTGEYSNLVSFACRDSSDRQIKAGLLTSGRAVVDRGTVNENRLLVEFYENKVVPYPNFSSKIYSRAMEDYEALVSMLTAGSADTVLNPMKIAGFSDVVCLNAAGDVRIMKGNAGSIYVLKKVKGSNE